MAAMLTSSEEDGELFHFPVIVAEKIARFLNGFDLINLSYTSKYWHQIAMTNSVWKSLVRRRFGENSLDKLDPITTDFKRLYFRLGATKRSVSKSSYIMNLQGRYLAKEVDANSYDGEVLHLKEVCWLQVNDTFPSVLPGRYLLQYRMKLDGVYVNGDPIEYRAKVEEGYGTSVCSKWSEQRLKRTENSHGSGTWFIAEMGELKIDKMCDVNVEIYGRVDYWCGGIVWDTVELKCLMNSREKPSGIKSKRNASAKGRENSPSSKKGNGTRKNRTCLTS